MISISAIICTFNRAPMIGKSLSALATQSLHPSKYEIVIVDNASTDETSEVVERFQEKHPEHSILYVHEHEPGLGHARNLGLQTAKGRYVAYVDDDARASASWLEAALDLFTTVEPVPICVGGMIIPHYEAPRPAWFKDEYETRSKGDRPRRLRYGEQFSGSNVIFDKGAIEGIGGFDTKVGVRGTLLSVGEETMLFRRIWQLKREPCLYYSPDLRVEHSVPPWKMRVDYQIKRYFVAGQVSIQMKPILTMRTRFFYIASSMAEMFRMAGRAIVNWKNYAGIENWLVEEWGQVFRVFGAFLAYLGVLVPIRQRPD